MANKTVVFTNYFLNGTSGLTLLLLDPVTAAIGNGAGDTLTAGSNGLFSAVVTEAITGWWNVVVLQGAVVVLEGGKVYFQSNTVGTYQVDDATHAAYAVYDEPMSGHTINGSYGSHLVRSANQNQNTVQITGSQHIAADIHEFQPGVITAADFAAGAITSTVLATDCITSDELAASAIAEIAAAASVTVNVTPLQAVADQMIKGTRIEVPLGYTGNIGPIVVTDVNNNPVNITAPSELIISKKWRGDILVIPDGSITRSGVGNNQFSFPSTGATLIPGTHSWALRRVSDNYVFSYGDWIVKQVATKDT